MDRYAIIIRPDEGMILLHCWLGDGLDLAEMQKIVEGNIETVPAVLAEGWSHEEGVGLVLIVNEEGKLLGLPANHMATDMAAVYNDVLVGNAILMGTQGEDFVGLTSEAAENIIEKWGTGGC